MAGECRSAVRFLTNCCSSAAFLLLDLLIVQLKSIPAAEVTGAAFRPTLKDLVRSAHTDSFRGRRTLVIEAVNVSKAKSSYHGLNGSSVPEPTLSAR